MNYAFFRNTAQKGEEKKCDETCEKSQFEAVMFGHI